MPSKNSVNEADLAKKVGLNPVTCPHCGRNVNVMGNLIEFFKLLVEEAAAGKRVMLKHFGVFQVKLYKSHAINTPVAPNKESYPDTNVLRYRMGQTTRAT